MNRVDEMFRDDHQFKDLDDAALRAAHRALGVDHLCPRCGLPTPGAWSEGGLRWALCDECMRREREAGK